MQRRADKRLGVAISDNLIKKAGASRASCEQQMQESLRLSVYIGPPCIESLAMSGKNRFLEKPFMNWIFVNN